MTLHSTGGDVQFIGETTGASVRIAAQVNVEGNHPDFAFLPGLVAQAGKNRGLTLPSAGSGLLRETARLMAARADELVRAGNMALQQGNKRGAKAVAEMALEADPENSDAKSLLKVSGNRLILQNPADSPFDDIFSDDAPAADTGACGGHRPSG